MDKNETLDFSFSYKLKAYNDYNFHVGANNKFSKTSVEAFNEILGGNQVNYLIDIIIFL